MCSKKQSISTPRTLIFMVYPFSFGNSQLRMQDIKGPSSSFLVNLTNLHNLKVGSNDFTYGTPSHEFVSLELDFNHIADKIPLCFSNLT